MEYIFENDLKMLKNFDWYYMMSDDHREYKQGLQDEKELHKFIKKVVDSGKRAEALRLWDEHAPNAPYSNSKMSFSSKVYNKIIH